MQFKALDQFADLIPIDNPRLTNTLYTKCFLYLMRNQNFATYSMLLRKIPGHLYDYNRMAKALDAYFETQTVFTSLKAETQVLDIFYRLYVLDGDYEKAFTVLVRKQDPEVFKFMREHELSAKFASSFLQLLKIDAVQTVDIAITRAQTMASNKDADNFIGECVDSIKRHYAAEMACPKNQTQEMQASLQKEALFHKFMFLQEVFARSRSIGKQFHQELIELCIRFNKRSLMALLRGSVYYNGDEALKVCKEANLYKE